MVSALVAALAIRAVAAATVVAVADAPPELDKYNVVWTSPSPDAAGSMPIGNGEMGANVWFQPEGELVLLLSRTDSFSEASRLLKLGRIRIRIEPNPLRSAAEGAAAAFRQELVLREGRMDLAAGARGHQTRLSVFVDPDHDVLHVAGESDEPVTVTATLENWRTERRVLKGEELKSSWTMHDAPDSVEVAESADVVDGDAANGSIVWYHRNESSVVPFTVEHQGMKESAPATNDPLIGRVFGGRFWPSEGKFTKTSPTSLRSEAPLKEFAVSVATHQEHVTAHAWKTASLAEAILGGGPADSRGRAKKWWNAFWDRSWVFVSGDRPDTAAAKEWRIPANEHPLRIGMDSDGKNRFAGQMARTCIYPRALTAKQVAQAASAPPNAPPRVLGVLPSWIDDPGSPPGPRFKKATIQESRGLSLESWIRPAAAASGRIFDKLTAGQSDGFLFDMHPGLSLRLIVGGRTITAKDCLKPDEWQHVMATTDPATGRMAIYLGGKLLAESRTEWGDAAPASRVTQAYLLQRWVTACMGRGEYPIKFNGGIFTVDPKHTGGPDFNPDWRRWGDCYWWQNTRLPYAPMLASGDFDMMKPLFAFFEKLTPVCRARTAAYYNAKGLYFPETMTMFGMYSNGDYGWKRDGLAPGDISPCPWWQWAWNQGPELVMLMLDYHDYTGDERFAREELVPMARDVMLYFDSRFKHDEHGKLLITPTQAVETYWHDVVNDTPCVAGLRATLPRLLAMDEKIVGGEDRVLFKRLLEATPGIPLKTAQAEGGTASTFTLPAEKYKDERSNVENPELYTVFPFRLFGTGKPDLDIARETYERRTEKSMLGWSYDGQCAAMLGLTDQARTQLLAKVANSNPSHRFPAMWGPNYDWLPDQCHGGNLMLTLQTMLLQGESDAVGVAGADDGDGKKKPGAIYLLPAWPREWDVSFKLHAPGGGVGGVGGTVVECEYRGGKITRLVVTPAWRRGDVVVPDGVEVAR